MARALDLSISEIVMGAMKDETLTKVIAIQASVGGRYHLLNHLVGDGAADAWIGIMQVERQVEHHGITLATATAWCAAAIQPGLWHEMPSGDALGLLYQKLRMALPEPICAQLLGCTAWRSFVGEATKRQQPADAAVFAAVAALTPAQQRPHLRSALVAVPPPLTARAFKALSLLDLIEAA